MDAVTSAPDTAIVWFTKDLRLRDNPAWANATSHHGEVLGVFVLEPALIQAAGPHRRNQLCSHLQALDHQLRQLGGNLCIRTGPPARALAALVGETNASSIYANADVSPFSQRRLRQVEAASEVPLSQHWGTLVHEPGTVLTQKGTLSQVFTPFYKTWIQTPRPDMPHAGDARVLAFTGEPTPTADGPAPMPGGEEAAMDRLLQWADHVDDYPETRDLLGIDGTSLLSTDLKFGTLSPATVLDVIDTNSTGGAAFVRQLAWRDWWAHTLAANPNLPHRAVRADYDKIQWANNRDEFEAWCTGMTGYPVVDAGMRQLVQTGFMHNRARMICASFLVKDLLVDWRWGERFFFYHLTDADPAQNAGNWQWVAGTGPDAAPYFRIFNPTTQSRKFDPNGDYVRRWVPELSSLSNTEIHEPASVPPLRLAEVGVHLGDTYPFPLVDHGQARDSTLAAYKAATA